MSDKSENKTFGLINLSPIYKWWLALMDDTVIPFLRSKTGMYITLGVLIYIIFY